MEHDIQSSEVHLAAFLNVQSHPTSAFMDDRDVASSFSFMD